MTRIIARLFKHDAADAIISSDRGFMRYSAFP